MILSGCGSKQPAYTPTASLSIEDAKRVIYRSLETQTHPYGANEIEIAKGKLSFSQVRWRGPVPTVFYFENLGKMDMTRKKKGEVVRVFDKGGVRRFYVVIPDRELAKQFMDAMLVMSLQNKTALEKKE